MLEIGCGVVPSRRALVRFAPTAPGVDVVRAEVEPADPAAARVPEEAGYRVTR
ncbi:hypothetical protein [Saccharothrix syringae]|uniref:hypothetical protein n=1 Tax=Saccharothrix syringae TaxID=103733 RepID=UPI000B320C7F|nr:hypothetical protein [Saccharothrix syringae]